MDDKLRPLKNYESMVEALFDQELLRNNGIDSTINNEDAVELLPMFGELNEGLRILVFVKDFDKATKVIEEYKKSLEEQGRMYNLQFKDVQFTIQGSVVE